MPKRKSTREHLLNTGAMIVGESGLRALTAVSYTHLTLPTTSRV